MMSEMAITKITTSELIQSTRRDIMQFLHKQPTGDACACELFCRAIALRDEQARKWLPWFADTFTQGRDVPPGRAARLVLLLASGRADALSGRFLDVAEDVAGLVRRAEEIKERDLYALRVGRLGPDRQGA